MSSIFKSGSCYKAFIISVVTFGLSYGLYKAVIDNYLAEIVHMMQFDRGVSEFFRELPGFLLMFVLALLYEFSAEKIFKTGALIMLAGMLMQVLIPAQRVPVTIAIFIYSLGEHMQFGMRNTIALQCANRSKEGAALGTQNAAYQFGTLAGYILVAIIFYFFAGMNNLFRLVFILSTLIIFTGFIFSLNMRNCHSSQNQDRQIGRFYFRKKYTKFYMLEIFYGARKQIFFTFGPYLLVLFYGAGAMAISILFAISAIAGFICSPIVGRIIDKLGYKIVMVADTLILVIVCLFYGFAHHIFPMNIAFLVCCVNYVLDSIISLASMASNVYVQDISDTPEEVKATISTGVSVNHLITILIALFGGWIWQVLGIETLFIMSAVFGLLNSAYAASIKVPAKN
ncbi:MAG: MFS transporter [Synergistaceae bacterium]|nr:MFS transporter [Synergistaceae bacterium]MBR0203985.1 MFS transporter [Synergistaceae bacterium]